MSEETPELVQAELGTLLEVSCPACSRVTKHQVIHELDMLHHLRCRSCSAILVCELQGSRRNAKPLDFAELLERVSGDEPPTPYRADGLFHLGEVVEHVSFGKGVVLSLYTPSPKMMVWFEDKRRVLVCGRTPEPEPEKPSRPQIPSTGIAGMPWPPAGAKPEPAETAAAPVAAPMPAPEPEAAPEPPKSSEEEPKS